MWKTRLNHWVRVFSWVYFTIVFTWVIARFLFEDRIWWLFAVNALSVYLFFPLPVVLLAAFFMRRRDIWLGVLGVFALAILLHGKVYLPWRTAFLAKGQPITVMTYNVLGYNEHADAVLSSILAADADVVSLQELNPQIAHAIHEKLLSKYPYQELDPRKGVSGSGVISRYPLHPSGETMPGTWVGTPQILSLTVAGKPVTILQAHAFATNMGTPEVFERTISERERQASAIRDFAQTHPGALIVPTDLNSTTQNKSYQIVTSVLSDAWMEAGWGLGNTFPKVEGVDFPRWLIRIDYIFYSHHFRAVDAQLGLWDGYSDHRPVVAHLVLTDQ